MSVYSPAPGAVGVLGTGSCLPRRVVPNSEVAAPAGVDEEWIVRKTGIRQRHYAAADEAASDLAARAAERALENAGLTPLDIDWILVATSTPDHPQPATAALVQHLLGAHGSVAFDVNAVCAGFVAALHTAVRLVAGPGIRGRALVIGAEVYSRILDPQDRRTAPLFGDGAGAVVVGPVTPERGLVGTWLTTDGALHGLIGVPAGGSRLPASLETVAKGEHYFTMRGRDVRTYVMRELPLAVGRLLSHLDIGADRVDHFVPHQANGAMLREVWELLGLGRARALMTVERHANTGAASIPLALDEANRAGTLAADELVLLAGFGGGMTTAAALLRWGR
ncbi:ketoacyl-ACP synthase III [Streptomyces canus]|uniref:3-oxoacyl-ACP synthase III family protein n=1 Tax=Streptomyces canus TaxID=58343 RepID=UPI002E2C9894|nr:ketoacyl-ACP synthase III [Streptomyces canus]